MHVLHVVGSLDRGGAGVAAAVTGLCSHLARQIRVSLVTTSYGDRYPLAREVELVLPRSWRIPGARLSVAPGFGQALATLMDRSRPDLVHVHGLWMPKMHAACAAARGRGIPYVVSPHGMLQTWAFRHKAWKKRLPWWIYQRRDLQRAVLLHATSYQEADGIRHYRLGPDVAVIPNGLDIPPWQEHDLDGVPRTLTFLGRIHPVKGLANFIEAWALVRPSGWRCSLVGPSEEGHRADLERRIRSAGLDAAFAFHGAVDDAGKWACLRQSDILVLPSHSENFGLVVAEALACGVPAIATSGTPWRSLIEENCGWMCAPTVDGLAGALRDATRTDRAQLLQMGMRGRSMVERMFAWSTVCSQMVDTYRGACSRSQP